MSTDVRVLDLLAADATEGLSDENRHELMSSLGPAATTETASMAAAAAAIDLSQGGLRHAMPPAVRQRARARLLDEIRASRHADVLEHPGSESTPAPVARHPGAASRSGRLGWLAAVAATAVAVIGWWPEPIDDALPPAEIRRPTAEERRGRLIEMAADTIVLPWQATDDPSAAGAGGDVVWSTRRQAGFMRFAGLPANDPTLVQYQLWIFDATGDDRYPVDGGVFDVTSTGEIVVPIEPKLMVGEPTLFAVTIEKPGGVVVSSRERLVLLARVG